MSDLRDLHFDHTLSASVPGDFRNAVARAAIARGLTVADYMRSALSARLAADGEPHPAIPELKRVTFLHAGIPARPSIHGARL